MVFRSVRNLYRLLRVARTLARWDALFLLERLEIAPAVMLAARAVPKGHAPGARQLRPGQRLAKALQELGPTLIKVGQALSTRSDLLGEEMAADLSELQDSLPPFSGIEARKIIEKELGAPIESLFLEFDDQAVAAASIAQVHFAKTHDGREVAVKVLRPEVDGDFEADFDLFYWMARLVEAAKPEMKRLKPVETVRALEETVNFEMDLRFEAAAATELRENFEGEADFHIPQIDWNRTSRRVMTLERISGIPIDERAALMKAGHNPDEVLEKASAAFFNMVFRDGLFHGDLHPGNLFVEDSGRIVAIDFGIVGRIDLKTRRHLAEMLVSFLTRDYRRAAEVHFEAGWIPMDQSVEQFTQACRSIADPILDKPQNEISMAKLLAQLFQITELFGMETQPQLLLLQKTMLVAEGTGRSLNPNVNMWMVAQPLIEDWCYKNLGPEARVKSAVVDAARSIESLPRILNALDAITAQVGRDGFKLHPETVEALRQRGSAQKKRDILWAITLIAAVTVTAIFAG